MGLDLISSGTLIQTPYIRVTIGNYTFGYYKDAKGSIHYPNFIRSLEVKKINGQVNTYTVNLDYQITENDDPNFMDKVLSSVSQSRSIYFTYGDMTLPNFLYKNESAMIQKVTNSFDIQNSKITYTITAISNTILVLNACYTFPGKTSKPSLVIRDILQNSTYGLQQLFTGMQNMTIVDKYNLIPDGDVAVNIETKVNMSVLDYLQYLVDLMTPEHTVSSTRDYIYVLTYSDDIMNDLGGPYFQIKLLNNKIEHSDAYELNIGYPNINCIYSFEIEKNESYAILYDYQKQLHPQEYVTRINSKGEEVDVYAPVVTSANKDFETTSEDTAWWSKMTQYPIKASIKLKGLLRPAVLMQYVRINTVFYGNKHSSSGLYMVTKHVDTIDSTGYWTTLNLTKVGGDV